MTETNREAELEAELNAIRNDRKSDQEKAYDRLCSRTARVLAFAEKENWLSDAVDVLVLIRGHRCADAQFQQVQSLRESVQRAIRGLLGV